MRFSAVILAVCLVLSPARVFAQFDFPNNPTLNQIVTGPGGQQFQWDGVKWVALLGAGTADFAPLTNPAGGQNNYAPLAAPTFTGTTTVGNLTAPGTATWTFPDGSTYTSAGHNNMAALGVGLAAASGTPVAGTIRAVNIIGNTNNNLVLSNTNQSNGATAQATLDLVNDLGHNLWLINTSSNNTSAAPGGPDTAAIGADAENGLVLNTSSPISSANATIRFAVLNNLVGTFNGGGLAVDAPPVPLGSATVFRGGQAELSAGLYTNNSLTEVTGGWNYGARYNGTNTIATAETFIQDYAVGTGNAPGIQPESERSWAIFTGQTVGQPVVTTPRAQYVALRPSGFYVESGSIFVHNAPIQTTYYWQGESTGVNYTTASTTPVLLDATKFQQSITVPVGFKLIAVFYADVQNTVAGGQSVCIWWGRDGSMPFIDTYAGGASNQAWQPAVAPHVWNGDGNAHTYAVYYASCTGQGTSEVLNGSFAQPVAILQMVASS